MGQPEHDTQTKAVPPEEVLVKQPLEDDEEEEEAGEIEKTEDQLKEEAWVRWRQFHYPGWATPCFWLMFFLCVINVVLTLDQWHGNHAWRLPFDIQPADRRYGGWPQQNHDFRFTACLLGVVSSCFSWVLTPNADKYKFMFVMMLIAGILHCFSFADDLEELNAAVDLPFCKKEMSHRYICKFTRYRATVIFDILGAVFSIGMAFFLLYQSLSGTVSRRTVFNQATQKFERIVLQPDEAYWKAFPPAFKAQRVPFNIIVVLTALINGTLLALSITQSTGDFMHPPGYDKPLYNPYYETPVDIFVINGNEKFLNGGWPILNFELRLATNIIALVVLAFAIQWRRDGRVLQAAVLTITLIAGCLYLACFAVDWEIYDKTIDNGTRWEEANGNRVLRHRYTAIIIFDAFNGFLLTIFAVVNIKNYLKQASKPHEEIEGVNYGWWCFGESKARHKAKKAIKAMDEA